MVLNKIDVSNGLVNTTWTTAFDTSWEGILKGVRALLPYYSSYDVGVGAPNQMMKINIDDEFIPPYEYLVLTGQSSLFEGPLKMTFKNNGSEVLLLFTTSMGFAQDYESLSRAFGQYMDSCEIMMCR